MGFGDHMKMYEEVTSASGNFNIITFEHMKKMKNHAIVGSPQR